MADTDAGTAPAGAGGEGKEAKDCIFWLRGECARGDACPFKHDPSKFATASPAAAPPAHAHGHPHAHGLLTPQRTSQLPPCKYYLAGYCDKGSACPFPHIVCCKLTHTNSTQKESCRMLNSLLTMRTLL